MVSSLNLVPNCVRESQKVLKETLVEDSAEGFTVFEVKRTKCFVTGGLL